LLICLAIVQAWYSIDQVLMFSIKRDYFTLLDLGVFFYIMFLGAFIFFVLSELLLFIYEAAPDIQFIVKFFFFGFVVFNLFLTLLYCPADLVHVIVFFFYNLFIFIALV